MIETLVGLMSVFPGVVLFCNDAGAHLENRKTLFSLFGCAIRLPSAAPLETAKWGMTHASEDASFELPNVFG